MKFENRLLIFLFVIVGLSCSQRGKDKESLTLSGLDPANFERVVEGDSTRLVVLRNENGMEVCLSNYGARILSLVVPDKEGKGRNVVLGFNNLESYFPEEDLPKLGGTIGRYTNRIAYARFLLDGDTVKVTENNFGHSLHGGAEDGDRGWQYKVFEIKEANDSSVLMTLFSPDGENGFPGNMNVSVRYTLCGDNSLRIDYGGETDKPTVICMSNQSYFNLSGNPDTSISDLRIKINASTYMPVDSTRLVTGEFASVEGTPMDFRKEKLIGRDIDNAWHEQIRYGKGYDHTFVFDDGGDLSRPGVVLHCRKTGIVMELYTTEPSVQFYTGNFLYSALSKKRNDNYSQRHGLSLEPQHFPDSPNHPQWPSVILRPGEKYHSTSIYKFSNDK